MACQKRDVFTDALYFDADRNAWDAFSETSKARDEACRESGQSRQSICVVTPVFVSLEVREKFQPCVWLVLNVTSLLSHSSTAWTRTCLGGKERDLLEDYWSGKGME